MVQIIGQGRLKPKSTSQQFGEAFSRLGEDASGHLYEQNQREMQNQLMQQKEQGEVNFLNRLYGEDLTGSSPKMREIYLGEKLKGQSKKGEREDEIQGIHSALDVVKQMRSIGKKGNLGFGLGFRKIFDPESRREAGEYEQLGKSLIQYASNIPIRNRQEFETLAESLYDPSITDDEREGVLTAMERILNNSLGGSKKSPIENKQEKPPLSSFKR